MKNIKTLSTRVGDNAVESDGDFKNMVDLLAVYSEAENQLAQLQVEVNEDYLQTVDSNKPEYARLQEKLTKAEAALELIVRRHTDWFPDGKTIKTPYGHVSLKQNPPKIVSDNEEVSIALIEAKENSDPELKAKNLLRETKELNLKTLASLNDVELAEFRLKRVTGDTFNVKAANLDMGKAVKEGKKSASSAKSADKTS